MTLLFIRLRLREANVLIKRLAEKNTLLSGRVLERSDGLGSSQNGFCYSKSNQFMPYKAAGKNGGLGLMVMPLVRNKFSGMHEVFVYKIYFLIWCVYLVCMYL